MARVDPTLLKRREVVKAAKALLRMKSNMTYDEVVARLIPEIEAAFDAAVVASQSFELDVLGLLDAAPSGYTATNARCTSGLPRFSVRCSSEMLMRGRRARRAAG